MQQCPECKGKGWFASHADGSASDDCDTCGGTGQAYDAVQQFPSFLYGRKYETLCPKCGRRGGAQVSFCRSCGYQFS
jgi:DnaJ-class molecular chaperone